MTRQPAEEKRITVAWPMPRLAPVRSSVRRGVLAGVGIKVLQSVGVTDRAALWSRAGPPYRGGIRCGRAGGTAGRARTRNSWGQSASRSSRAAGARRLRICGELTTFLAGDMAVKDKTVAVIALHQHHSHIRQAVGIDGGKRHGVGIVRLSLHRFGKPLAKQRERFLRGGKITGY